MIGPRFDGLLAAVLLTFVLYLSKRHPKQLQSKVLRRITKIMVVPVKLRTVSRDTMEAARSYSFHNSNIRGPSLLDLQLHASNSAFEYAMTGATTTAQRYPRTIRMASQYNYYLPIDDSRYDNPWVHSPSSGRAVPSPEPSTTTGAAAAASSAATTLAHPHQNDNDDLFEIWCRKVTPVHDDMSIVGGEDDTIEFEAIESPPRRTVSISNSTTSNNNVESSSTTSSQTILKDTTGHLGIDQRLFEHGLNNSIQLDDDDYDDDDNDDDDDGSNEGEGAPKQVVEGFGEEIKMTAIVSSSSPSPSWEHSSYGEAMMKDDESTNDHDDDCSSMVAKKTKNKRSPAKKRQTRKNKTPSTTTLSSNKPRNNNNNNPKKAKAAAALVVVNNKKDMTVANANGPDAPLRALSAYNFFFRDERERQLEHVPMVLDDAKCDKLLEEHWYRDRTQKRRHRKSHGKIPFTQLSKIVSSQWKLLTKEEKDFYRQVSAKDWARYQREMGEYRTNSNNNNNNDHQGKSTNAEEVESVMEEDVETQHGMDHSYIALDGAETTAAAAATADEDDEEPFEEILSAEV
jgi:HMG (high mobility group) box